MKILFQYKDIEISTDDTLLVIRNSNICRKLDLSAGAPKTVSLTDATGKEFASPEKENSDLAFIGMYPAGAPEPIHWRIVNISAERVPASYKDSEHVKVTVEMKEDFSETDYLREYFIYPEFSAISVQNSISLQVQPLVYWTNRGRLKDFRYFTNQRESVADSISCAEGIRPELAVMFRGRTDYTDELVEEISVEDKEFFNGNILFCSDKSGAGFLFLQEAPPSEERRDLEDYDFHISGNRIDSCCWGIHPSEATRGSRFTGYRHDLILYSKEQDRTSKLKQFIRKRFPAHGRTIMVNPWGCGYFRDYICEQFLIDEMKASGEIGADYYQIDDEWQTGKSLANLQVYNKRVRDDFWTISRERLNGSFHNIITAANEAGVKPALWIAPSLNCEYEDWKTQAEMILNFHKVYGFTNFKIDGVLIRSKKAEDNLRALLDYVVEKSDGKVYFNLDTTNGQRPGYFLFLEYGNIFLENRYVHAIRSKPVNYHPEHTLRNLWMLSKYMCPEDLQIEVASPGSVADEVYSLENRPDSYSLEYWAAIALVANPLIWTAPSKISAEEKLIFRKMNDLHRKLRDQLSDCEIIPIGKEPDGSAVTGFFAKNRKQGKSFLLLFREKNSMDEKSTITLPCTKAVQWNLIAGVGAVTGLENGEIEAELPAKSYLLAESVN